jgi:hypothetical protein
MGVAGEQDGLRAGGKVGAEVPVKEENSEDQWAVFERSDNP